MSLIKDLLTKSHRSVEAAMGLCEDGLHDDATSRAYYAMYDAARALILHVNPTAQGHSHKFVLSEFSRSCVRPGHVGTDWPDRISRTQGARHVADYDGDSITATAAAGYAKSARELLDIVTALVPAHERPVVPNLTAREMLRQERETEIVKRALADTFGAALDRKNETYSTNMLDELVLYGTMESLTILIVNVEDMQDLKSYVSSLIPIPSLG